jgi:hypothetical protein
MEACFVLRDKVAFHIDREPVMNWLDRQPTDRAICLFSQGGRFVKDIISDAPLEMLDEEAQKALDLEAFNHTLVEVVAALPRLLDAMCHGFVKKFGLSIDRGVRQGHRIVYFFDPRLDERVQ